jgi:RNA polymerase sigma-70 factor, ECF subfamily
MLEGEKKLIEAAGRGEKTSFTKLYDYYMPAIYRFIYVKVSHRHIAEDLTHEVFLSAWQNLPRYRHKGFPFSSWLYKLARNRVIDHYRGLKPSTDIENINPEELKINSVIESTLDDDFQFQLVKSAIQALKPDQQDVLIMKFIEDLSHKEIALTLKKSEGAIRLIQHRAIQELKKQLKDISQ